MNKHPDQSNVSDTVRESAASRLLRHSLLLLAAGQISNVANMLFQMLMNRRLPGAEYGVLATMLAMVTIATYPLVALRAGAAYFTAILVQHRDTRGAARVTRMWLLRLALGAGLIIIGGVMTAPLLARLLQLPAPLLMGLTAGLIALSLFQPVLTGALQGVEAFGWLALVAPVQGLVRLLAGATVTAWIAATAMAAMGAQALGIIAASLLAAYGLRRAMPMAAATDNPPRLPLPRYVLGACLALLGFSFIMHADVVLVKYFFPPELAGTFARAANAARMVVFLPLPIATAMFPKVVTQDAGQVAGHHRILGLALVYTCALVLAAAFIGSWGAGLIWRIFTGTTADGAELALLRGLLWAMSPLGACFIMLQFELARRRFRAAWILAIVALLYV
ncbi:MAG: hypothetical protein LC725_10310, partial [Lentisphaerae bacterium]|nr:hypothetical protein [Lentisphaerota bacterium]